MYNEDQNDGERVVFWVVGAVVTILLATLLWWKLSGVAKAPLAAAPTSAEQVQVPDGVSLETGAPVQTVSDQPLGDDQPKFLGELEAGFNADSGLTLTGSVQTERKKERLLSQAKLVFGDNRVVDQLTVSESAPTLNWKGKTLDLMAKLATLGPFKLFLKDNQIKLETEVKDDAAKAAWLSWLENFFVDQPLAVDASGVTVNEASSVSADTFESGTLFNLAVNFASGSSEIPADATATLEQAAQILRDDGRSLRIVGHTDSSGDETKNRQLSEDRAASVRNFLVDRGVNPSSLSSYGLGSDQPLADNATEEGRAKNRRIEFKSN